MPKTTLEVLGLTLQTTESTSATGVDASATPVSAIMSASPVCVKADLPIERLIPLLVDENIGGVPVVDDQGCPLGMVSKTDLLAEEADRADAAELQSEFPPVGELLLGAQSQVSGRHTAGELMSTPLLSVLHTDAIARAAELMAARHIHRLGVIDERGRLVGVISASDLVRWLAAQGR